MSIENLSPASLEQRQELFSSAGMLAASSIDGGQFGLLRHTVYGVQPDLIPPFITTRLPESRLPARCLVRLALKQFTDFTGVTLGVQPARAGLYLNVKRVEVDVGQGWAATWSTVYDVGDEQHDYAVERTVYGQEYAALPPQAFTDNKELDLSLTLLGGQPIAEPHGLWPDELAVTEAEQLTKLLDALVLPPAAG